MVVFAATAVRRWTSNSHSIDNHTQQDTSTKKKRKNRPFLELVHIPKTGGTTLEKLAARHGITWGMCHYVPDQGCPGNVTYHFYHYRQGTPLPKERWAPFWHVPPRYYRRMASTTNTTTVSLFPNPYPLDIPLFAVVRNPYERLLSEWYFSTITNQRQSPRYSNNASKLNAFVHQLLGNYKRGHVPSGTVGEMTNVNPYWLRDAHFIPQSHYCFDVDGTTPVVQHILKFESLQPDFNQLMRDYGMNDIILGDEHNNAVDIKKELSIWNLTDDSVRLLNEVYHDDFVAFGYEKLLV